MKTRSEQISASPTLAPLNATNLLGHAGRFSNRPFQEDALQTLNKVPVQIARQPLKLRIDGKKTGIKSDFDRYGQDV